MDNGFVLIRPRSSQAVQAARGSGATGSGSLPHPTVPPEPGGGRCLISGYSSQETNPYSFGASAPSLVWHERASIEKTDVAKTLSSIKAGARTVPDIRGAEPRWMAAISSLRKRGGNDKSLCEAASHIQEGIQAELHMSPRERRLANSGSVNKCRPDIRQRIDEYLAINAIHVLSSPPPLWQPLLAVRKPGKKARLCLDLARNFNDSVTKRKFKMLSVQTATRWSTPGCWYGKLDLSSCFLSFPLHPNTASYFNFEFEGRFYRFDSCPFGLSSAPRVVSLLLDVVSSHLHDLGVRAVRYLDDFLIIGRTKAATAASMSLAASVLASFGLCVNPDKVEGVSQQMEFLGILLDSVATSTSLTPDRISELKALLVQAASLRKASRRFLLSLLGKLSFAASVLPAARPFMRFIIDAASFRAKERGGRASRLQAGFKDQVSFWLSHIEDWNGSQQWRSSSSPFVVASDASTEGFGFVVEAVPSSALPLVLPSMLPGAATAGVWGKDFAPICLLSDSCKRIAFAELYCPVAVAEKLGRALENSHVVFILDNSSDVSVINRRRTKDPRLLFLLQRLTALSIRWNFAFTAIHRRGAVNILPDILSRPREHQFRLDPTSLAPKILEKRNQALANPTSSVPFTEHSYGAFFLDDPVTPLCSLDPVFTPFRVSLVLSDSALCPPKSAG